jgi:molybdopterin molybdotransferase
MSGFEIDEPQPPKREHPDAESVWGRPPQDTPAAPPPSPAAPVSTEPASDSGWGAPPAEAPPAAPPPAEPSAPAPQPVAEAPAAAPAADHHHHGGDEPMRQVDEVRRWILDRVPTLQPIELPLQEAQGCVLATDVSAQLDLPPFSSSAMDGFAVRSADVAEATAQDPVRLRIVGRVAAGQQPDATVGLDEAIRIATGAPVPAGADTIVPVEDTSLEGEAVRILRPGAPGAFIRPAGQDVKAGTVLVPKGRRVSAPELGLLASAGYSSVLVHPRPRVVVISTGDELVEPGRPASFGLIRDSNAFTLYGGLRDAGAEPFLGGIVRDDVEQLRETVLGLAIRADCFISSGGVSVGERDVVKKAFFRRGDIEFYKVAMQPGMPQGFGAIEGKPYWGLPGNPVSVFVSFEVFIRPALLKMMGRSDIFRPEVSAILETDVSGPKERMVFARVRVTRHNGEWHAASTGPGQSNLISTVAKANGLAIIPQGVGSMPAGAKARVMLFRALEDEG